jgi:hypothetical protein
MKNLILTLTLILGFITVGYCDDPPPFNPSGPDSIPVDGGSILLLGAAVGYGIKKVNEKKSDVVETE